MNTELIRIVDGIARDKNIEKDSVFFDLEQAMISAVRKAYGPMDDVVVTIDRLTGQIEATRNGEPIEMRELGRIAAQTAKQVMIQKIREAERGSIFDEFAERKSTVVTGTVTRFEGGALIVNLGRAEGFLPKSEQIPGESQHPGERVRAMILDVREAPRQVKIVLSRSHPDFIRRLFELEVPEVSERIIEIKALAREAGYRTKIAVSSIDMKVDAVGACVGVRGSRIKNIVVELGGEKIDIVRWNESSQILISNALKPAEVAETALCFELNRATVVVPEDQLSLAIGKRGQNVRLAARLTGWDIDILTPAEYNRNLDSMEKVLSALEGVTSEHIDKMMALGIVSLMDLEEIGLEPLVKDVGFDEKTAKKVIEVGTVEGKKLQAEAEAAKAAAEKAKAEAEAAAAVSGETGAAETGAAETGAGETGAAETGAGETGAGEVEGESAAGEQLGAHADATQAGSAESGSAESGSAESGLTQAAATEADTLITGAGGTVGEETPAGAGVATDEQDDAGAEQAPAAGEPDGKTAPAAPAATETPETAPVGGAEGASETSPSAPASEAEDKQA